MNAPPLVRNSSYFGLLPQQFREATSRVLARIAGRSPDAATIGLNTLALGFRLSVPASRELADRMVQSGLLKHGDPHSAAYAVTERFRGYAQARIVEPLPREKAQLLISHFGDVARRFNRTAASNKYEIEAIAVHGSYMSRDAGLAELSLGITGRRRHAGQRTAEGRATTPTEGTKELRALFEGQNEFVQVDFYKRVQDAPRPFSVIFQAED
ncbi:MAG: hypothetical protein ABI886_11940 [Betaproteobacteria bacterium]